MEALCERSQEDPNSHDFDGNAVSGIGPGRYCHPDVAQVLWPTITPGVDSALGIRAIGASKYRKSEAFEYSGVRSGGGGGHFGEHDHGDLHDVPRNVISHRSALADAPRLESAMC